METWRPWPHPTPLCTTGRLEKRADSSGETVSEGKKSQRKEAMNESQRDEEGEERAEPKYQRCKEKHCEWVGCGVQEHWLVEAG